MAITTHMTYDTQHTHIYINNISYTYIYIIYYIVSISNLIHQHSPSDSVTLGHQDDILSAIDPFLAIPRLPSMSNSPDRGGCGGESWENQQLWRYPLVTMEHAYGHQSCSMALKSFLVSPDSSHRRFFCEIKSSHPLSAETWPNPLATG